MADKSYHREYMRKWRAMNRNYYAERRLLKMREEALADLESVEKVGANVYIFTTKDGCKYLIGGERR